MSKLSIVTASFALAIASLGAPNASQAQISPAPHNFTLGGVLTFSTFGGPPVDCAITMTIAVEPSGLSGARHTLHQRTGSPGLRRHRLGQPALAGCPPPAQPIATAPDFQREARAHLRFL